MKLKTLQAELVFLKKVLAVMPEHVYWKDSNKIYLGCNTKQAKMAGFKSAKELIGKTDYDLLPKKEADILYKTDQQVIQEKKPYSVEEHVTLPNNKKAVFLSHKIPLEDLEGNVIGILGVSVDITQRKEMEEALKKAKEKAERANQIKTDFIRNMEHDIRTPFAGIVSIAEGLEKQETDSIKKEYLNCIKTSAKMLLDYCNNILDFARIETGIPICEKKFNIRELINNLKNLEMPAAKEKNIGLKTCVDADVPKIVIGDEFRLSRILMNLLSNAIKFTHKGQASLNAHLSKKQDKNVILQFVVTDTGIGIPKDKQDMIYEKFTRLSPSNKGQYSGSGIGLSIVKEFLKEIEGEIDVESEIGKGTTFICTIKFKLPLLES